LVPAGGVDVEGGDDAGLQRVAAGDEIDVSAGGVEGDGVDAAELGAVSGDRRHRRRPCRRTDLLVIENVGNLVCPAEFDVGQHARAMVYAITEGEEKPLKYPVMFRAVDVVVVNKIDLLPHLDFDLDRFLDTLASVNPTATVIQLSARTGEGVAEWCDWLRTLCARTL